MGRGKVAINLFLSLILGIAAFYLWSRTSLGHQIVFKQSAILRSDIAKITVVPNTFANLRIYLFAYSVKQTLHWIKLLAPFVLSAGLLLLAASALLPTKE